MVRIQSFMYVHEAIHKIFCPFQTEARVGSVAYRLVLAQLHESTLLLMEDR